MKSHPLFYLALFLLFSDLSARAEADPKRLANTIILDPVSVKNLGLETLEAEETTFEETLFSLGRIEVLPGKRAIVSSRIPGRVFSVLALPDQEVDEGNELMWVESRQPGDPPPTVMLEAPMAGIISKVNVAVGQPISPDQMLIEIVDLSVVEAAAQVPEHLAGRLKMGLKARIRLSGFPDKVFEADLAHLGAFGNSESGTLEAAFHLQNPNRLLRPEMRAEFEIVVGRRDGVMSIPRKAVQGDAGGRFVFIKDYELDNAFVKTPVRLGVENTELVEVISGLLPGDEVVTHGGYSLTFAGKGSVSLREALDAAHGHPHNEDGSEMTKEQLANQAGDHDHHEASDWNSKTIFFATSTALLLVLITLSGLLKRIPSKA